MGEFRLGFKLSAPEFSITFFQRIPMYLMLCCFSLFSPLSLINSVMYPVEFSCMAVFNCLLMQNLFNVVCSKKRQINDKISSANINDQTYIPWLFPFSLFHSSGWKITFYQPSLITYRMVYLCNLTYKNHSCLHIFQ